jgi:fatty acid desaturase
VGVIGRLRLSFWIAVAGAIVLYVFFITIASVPPAQVASVTVVVATLTAIFVLRNIRIASELADRGGDPRLRRSLNRIRERRGF